MAQFQKGKLTNADLEKLVDTNDEWIVSRTGIKERRKCAPGQAMSDLGAEIVKGICDKRGISPLEIDMIIVGQLPEITGFQVLRMLYATSLEQKMLGVMMSVLLVQVFCLR